MARAYGDGLYGESLYGDDLEGIGAGNGGEQFRLQLAPNGSSETATLTADLGAGTGGTLALTGDSGLPATGTFLLTIDDEVIAVHKTGAGSYGVARRGLSNTTPAPHLSGADAVWDDTYLMAVAALVGMLAVIDDLIGGVAGPHYGWLVVASAAQAYLPDSARYPLDVAEVVGVFPPGTGAAGGTRLDGAQDSAVHTPQAESDDCPSGLTVPAKLDTDIEAGDVTLCRFTNPTAEILTLGPRAAVLQGVYGFGRRDDDNNDVTNSDPDGHVVDGTTHGEFFEQAFVTATLPGDDRTFTYGPPRFSNKGWPIAALGIRHGRRRVPLWTSPTWHNFNYIYTGFHADAVFVQFLINRNGIVYGPFPEVDLPHPDDIDGPDATWDATAGYYTSTSWYVGIFGGALIALGPALNVPSGGASTTPQFIPTVTGTVGGTGGGTASPDEDLPEGGSGGDIGPPVGVGVHLHTDLGELPLSNPHLSN